MPFQPDYRHIVDAVTNKRPTRLPLYEHLISPAVMEKILGNTFADLQTGEDADLEEFFTQYCRFFKEMTYDTVSFEVGIVDVLPDSGALLGGKRGPIQSREDFEKYPWGEIPRRYWALAERQFAMLGKCLPEGMKAVGGVGYGVFEISEDLVGFEHLCYMQADDPELFADLYHRIGDLMVDIWGVFLQRHAMHFAVCRMGDDLGFKTGTLLSPDTVIRHIVPQYHRLVELVHNSGWPFLLHSCGKIFDVMEAVIDTGIDAKHSNEDVIAPFEEWISRYGEQIGLLGGIDVDILCTQNPGQITRYVIEKGLSYRNQLKGYALGSGNSIPDYVPVEGYLAMIHGAQQIRLSENFRL